MHDERREGGVVGERDVHVLGAWRGSGADLQPRARLAVGVDLQCREGDLDRRLGLGFGLGFGLGAGSGLGLG